MMDEERRLAEEVRVAEEARLVEEEQLAAEAEEAGENTTPAADSASLATSTVSQKPTCAPEAAEQGDEEEAKRPTNQLASSKTQNGKLGARAEFPVLLPLRQA
ncbi:unnamed protein product [Effrenium voratum]|nr:unnamed protein product [Effrenium voratum]